MFSLHHRLVKNTGVSQSLAVGPLMFLFIVIIWSMVYLLRLNVLRVIHLYFLYFITRMKSGATILNKPANDLSSG